MCGWCDQRPPERRRTIEGQCGWVTECPEDIPCTEDECGPAPGAPSYLCEDGETWGGPGECQRTDGWACGYPVVDCPPAETCEPGESFAADDGCNTCECPESGLKIQAACTEIGCGPGPDECIPGESFDADDGCNTCQCPESGLKSEAACTRIACEPDPDQCTPGESFPAGDGCNDCLCPESGLKSEATDCTEAFCSTPCRTQADCLENQYCDFPDDSCGVFQEGICAGREEICPAGGVGVCGCDGTYRLNECELSGTGVDVFRFGGCSSEEPTTFACGDRLTCDAELSSAKLLRMMSGKANQSSSLAVAHSPTVVDRVTVTA